MENLRKEIRPYMVGALVPTTIIFNVEKVVRDIYDPGDYYTAPYYDTDVLNENLFVVDPFTKEITDCNFLLADEKIRQEVDTIDEDGEFEIELPLEVRADGFYYKDFDVTYILCYDDIWNIRTKIDDLYAEHV